MNNEIRELGREVAERASAGDRVGAYALLNEMRAAQHREAERRREDMRAFLAGEMEQVS